MRRVKDEVRSETWGEGRMQTADKRLSLGLLRPEGFLWKGVLRTVGKRRKT